MTHSRQRWVNFVHSDSRDNSGMRCVSKTWVDSKVGRLEVPRLLVAVALAQRVRISEGRNMKLVFGQDKSNADI